MSLLPLEPVDARLPLRCPKSLLRIDGDDEAPAYSNRLLRSWSGNNNNGNLNYYVSVMISALSAPFIKFVLDHDSKPLDLLLKDAAAVTRFVLLSITNGAGSLPQATSRGSQ